MKVLEIGTGTGYNAALIAEAVGSPSLVVSIDIQPDVIADVDRSLARAGYSGVRTIVGDGFEGVPDEAPFDRIIATVGCPDISPFWLEQLKPGGFMLVPLAHGGWHPLTRIENCNGRVAGRVLGYSGFMPIQGRLESRARPNGPLGLDLGSYGSPVSIPCPQNLRRLHDNELWYSFPPQLYYFLAAKDHRAFFSLNPRGYGLLDGDSGLVLVLPFEGQILCYGCDTLLDEFLIACSDWKRSGYPSSSDAVIEFTRLAPGVATQQDMEFVVDCQFFRRSITFGIQ
jgi:protein-L-isoaspartate(D-aspartate) O-methyltransferase